ncbi:hypothetical protein FN846DRAFT_886007 [Sphaerosporella brunnea]|uniref:Uncharacterized protein n=1 Tax=Sphaerosporella brunnea TaxID=1250544 RepID=A0A5J5FB12_9PEZI|nr:hypothetical protein FN846DRAFT_886007 [Sphaerosporella brunnea]
MNMARAKVKHQQNEDMRAAAVTAADCHESAQISTDERAIDLSSPFRAATPRDHFPMIQRVIPDDLSVLHSSFTNELSMIRRVVKISCCAAHSFPGGETTVSAVYLDCGRTCASTDNTPRLQPNLHSTTFTTTQNPNMAESTAAGPSAEPPAALSPLKARALELGPPRSSVHTLNRLGVTYTPSHARGTWICRSNEARGLPWSQSLSNWKKDAQTAALRCIDKFEIGLRIAGCDLFEPQPKESAADGDATADTERELSAELASAGRGGKGKERGASLDEEWDKMEAAIIDVLRAKRRKVWTEAQEEMATEISDMQAQYADILADRERILAQLVSMQEQEAVMQGKMAAMEDLQHSVEAQLTQMAAANEKIDALGAEIESSRALLADKDRQVQALLADKDRQVQALRSDIAISRALLVEKDRQLQDMATELQCSRALHEDKDCQLAALKAEVAKWQAAHATIQAQLTHKSRGLEELQAQVAKQQEMLAAANAAEADLKEQNAYLTQMKNNQEKVIMHIRNEGRLIKLGLRKELAAAEGLFPDGVQEEEDLVEEEEGGGADL